jgi:hypothetical protein
VPPAVPLAAVQLEALVGRYHSRDNDFTIHVRRDGTKLFGRVEPEPEIELIAQSPTRFLAPGWLAPVEFILDAEGRAKQLASLEVDRVLLDRLP